MLLGFDKKWQDIKFNQDKTAQYDNLKPGEYKFKVIAANSDGIKNDRGAEFNFILEQYFYETLSLFIPIRRVHQEKDCNPEIINRLQSDGDNDEGDTDPRWEKLKEL